MSVSTASGVSATHVDPNIFRGDVAPTGAVEGTLWIDTSTNPNTLNVADSSGTFSPISGGGGGSSTPLEPWDFWTEARFHSGNAIQGDFNGASFGGGSSGSNVVVNLNDGRWHNGHLMQKPATANAGYRWHASNVMAIRFGTTALVFWCAWRPMNLVDTVVYSGYHDATSITEPADGAYFRVIDGVAKGVCKNFFSAPPAETVGSFAFVAGNIYLLNVSVAADASSATFRILDGVTKAVLFEETVTSGELATTNSRATGIAHLATGPSAAAIQIGAIYWLGFGTPDGFTKARG